MRIENHSRLKDVELDVRDHLVLVGPNEVGKSSVIRCLDFVLGASAAQLYAQITTDDFRDVAKPFIVEATLEEFTSQEKALFPDEISVDSATGMQRLKVRLEATIDDQGSLDVRRSVPGKGVTRQLSRDQLRGLGWRMIGATAGARDFRENRNASLDDILHSVDLGPEKADFDALATQFEKKLKDSKVLEGLRNQLADQLSKALPAAVKTDELTFVPAATANNDVLSDVQLRITRDGVERFLSEQSDGMRALFAMALYDLVSASANMVAIDEPERHLHPASQRSLAGLLQASSNQKIIATHSSDIVGAFRPELIVTVKPGGQLVQPTAGFLSSEERLMAHWWVRDKLEPLTATRVVAVEGVSDRILVQRAAEVTGRQLDRIGVCVMETDGAGDMGTVLKLFGTSGFQIDLSIIIDQDAAAETAKKIGVPEAKLNDHSAWVSKPDLEAEYVAAIGADHLWLGLESSGLFSSNELARCATSGAGGTRTAADVATFCRQKGSYKVRSAIVAAGLLSDVNARRITSINSLLDEFAPGV